MLGVGVGVGVGVGEGVGVGVGVGAQLASSNTTSRVGIASLFILAASLLTLYVLHPSLQALRCQSAASYPVPIDFNPFSPPSEARKAQ